MNADISDLLGRHVPAWQIQRALDALNTLGHVRVVREATGGREREVWHAV